MIDQKMFSLAYRTKNFLSKFKNTSRLDYDKRDLSIYVDNPREYLTRANSCKKEPGTIKWLEGNVKEGTVFFDIGANIGAYTLVASSLGARTFAFEPAFQNFHQLNRNITLNSLDEKVSVFPIAFSQSTKIENFKYMELTPGTSKCYYNEEDNYHLDLPLVVEKATLIYSLDNFIKTMNLPQPEMLKIDVDGGELDIVLGAKETLVSASLRTVQVEIDKNFGNTEKILDILKSCGLKQVSEEKFQLNVSNFIFERA